MIGLLDVDCWGADSAIVEVDASSVATVDVSSVDFSATDAVDDTSCNTTLAFVAEAAAAEETPPNDLRDFLPNLAAIIGGAIADADAKYLLGA